MFNLQNLLYFCRCLKKKREQKKEENLNSPPKAYDLISKYSCKIPLPSVPIASTSSQPGTTVTKNHLLKHPQEESIPQPENPSNKDEIVKPVIRVKSSKELGIVEFSGKEHDNTNLLGNCKREILDLEKKTLLDRYIAVVKHYFTQERIYLIVDLVDTLRSALIVLCKKKILKVYNSEELNNADCSVLQEFSKKFVNTFSKALEKVDDSHKTLFVTATFSVITKQVEVRQFSVEIVQTVIKKLLKLESYSDEIVIEILEHKNFGSKINVLKNILIHHIDFGKFENLVSFKNEEVKSEEDEENFQKEEQVSTFNCFLFD